MVASTAEGRVSGATGEVGPPRFVGREHELAAVREVLGRSGPVVVLVEGEAGIGKTRFVRELVEPGDALTITCPPYSQPFTFGPVIDALRDAVDDVRRLSLSPLAGALRPIFPEWAGHLPPTPERLDDPAASQHRMFRALAELIESLDAGVLVVEDAHWADQASLDLLLFLHARAAPSPLVLTYRPSELSATSPLQSLTSRLARDSTHLRITLSALGLADTAQLVSSMLGERPVSDSFAEFLHARTEGLPLALEETVRLLHDRADLTRRDGEWVRRHLHQIEVPPTVRDGVLERFGRLRDQTRAVLRAVAIFGEPADESSIAALSGLPPDAVREGMGEGLEALILEVRGDEVGFRHVLVAHAVYDATPPLDRRSGHLVAGELLERREPKPLARLATHFQMAGDVPRWCRYAEEAADLASAAGDEATSVGLLFGVVLGADLSGGELARLADKITFSATVGAERYAALIDVLQGALGDGDVEPNVRGLLRFQLARVLSNGGQYAESRRELEAAIPDLEGDAIKSARAMLMLSQPFGTDWPATRHVGWLQRARTIEVPADPSERTRVLVDRAWGLLSLGEPAGWDELALIPTDSTDPQSRDHIARGQVNFSDAAMVWGRYDVAARSLDRAEHLAQGRGFLRMDDLILLNRARLDWFTGNWSGLSERVDALTGNDDIPAPTRLEPLIVALGLQNAADPGGAPRSRVERVWDLAREYPLDPTTIEAGSLLALRHLMDGRLDDAVQVSADALALVRRKELWLWATELAPVRVSALLAAGHTADAAALVADFARGIDGRQIPAAEAALATCRALVDAAGAMYARAVQTWEELPRPYAALRTRERWARHELARGETKPGLARLSAAFDGLADLGARADATRVLETLREHGVERRRPWWGGRTGYGDELSPRELEVVRLVAEGRTNREVAEALFRSPHTVSSQLGSAMRKLGVSSRRDLVVPD